MDYSIVQNGLERVVSFYNLYQEEIMLGVIIFIVMIFLYFLFKQPKKEEPKTEIIDQTRHNTVNNNYYFN